MINICDITGIILAGGKSKRMGKEKALLPFDQDLIINRILTVLDSVFEKVVIISNNIEKFNFTNKLVLQDIFQDSGPLSGIYSALYNLDSPYFFIMPCDIPLITTEIIYYTIQNSIEGKINIINDGLKINPLFGIYSKFYINILEIYLKDGNRKALGFIEKHFENINIIDLKIYRNKLKNINSPQDYEALLELINKNNV